MNPSEIRVTTIIVITAIFVVFYFKGLAGVEAKYKWRVMLLAAPFYVALVAIVVKA